MKDNLRILGISCGILKDEINELIKNKLINIDFIFLDSMLHMSQNKLEKTLDKKIMNSDYDGYLLVYGDCHSRMDKYDTMPNVLRLKGTNCCDIILDSNKYRCFRKEGAFILLHEWVDLFEHIFVNKFGLHDSNAKNFFTEFHKKLIYLDAKITQVPSGKLKEISEYTGLPVEIIEVDLNKLSYKINTGVEQLKIKLEQKNG